MVYPLIHRTKNDDQLTYDGCGFIVVLGDSPVFVTCRHNLTNNENADSFILINGVEYQTGPGIDGFFMDAYDGSKSYKLSTGELFAINDYAFQLLDLPVEDVSFSQLADATNMSKHMQLLLHTVNAENGAPMTHPCSRVFKHYGMEENIWRAYCNQARGGYCGGTVCTPENEIVGFLISGAGHYITIIKSETINPFFRYLNEG